MVLITKGGKFLAKTGWTDERSEAVKRTPRDAAWVIENLWPDASTTPAA